MKQLLFVKRLEDSPRLQKIVKNAGWLFLDKVFRLGIGLFVGVWIARYLGPEQYGILSYAQAFVILFSALASLGMDDIVVRDIVSDPDNTQSTLGSAFFLRLAGGFLTLSAALFVYTIIYPFEAENRLLIGIIAAGSVFQAFDTVGLWFQARVRSRFTVYAKSFAFSFISFIKVVLILSGASLLSFAWAGLAEVAMGALGLVLAYRIDGHALREWKVSFERGKKLLKDSWPLFIALLSYSLYARIDQVMIGIMLDDHSVGIYSASSRLYEVNLAVLTVLISSVYPDLVDMYNKNKAAFFRRYIDITDVCTIIAYVIMFIFIFFGNGLVNLLYGPLYWEVSGILAIQMFGLLFMFNAGLRSSFLSITSSQKIILLTTVTSAMLNIALNYVLIPEYGVKGAAGATVITQAISLLVSNVFFNQTKQIFLIQVNSLILYSPLKRLFSGKV